MSFLRQALTFLLVTGLTSHASISVPLRNARCSLVLKDVDTKYTVSSSPSRAHTTGKDALIDMNTDGWKSENPGGPDAAWWKLTFDDDTLMYFASISLDFTNSKGVVITVTHANGDESSIQYLEANMMRDLDIIGNSIKIEDFDTNGKPRLKNVAIAVCRVCTDGNLQKPCTTACDTTCQAMPTAKCSADGCDACAVTFYDDLNNVVDCDN